MEVRQNAVERGLRRGGLAEAELGLRVGLPGISAFAVELLAELAFVRGQARPQGDLGPELGLLGGIGGGGLFGDRHAGKGTGGTPLGAS